MESNPVKAQPPGTTLRPLTFLIWQLFLCFMIVTNAITIGIEADHASPDSIVWFVIGTVYLVVFTVELVLNLFAFGWVYWEVSCLTSPRSCCCH
jgi:hypothetical protein